MNRQTALLKALRGSNTKRDFARLTGISPRMLNAIESGERRPGHSVISRLIRHFPERSAEIARVFFCPEVKHDSADMSTIVPEQVNR